VPKPALRQTCFSGDNGGLGGGQPIKGGRPYRIVTQLKIDGEALPELILWRPELEEGGGMRWLRRLEPQHRKN